MKKHRAPSRSPRKLAINKDALRTVPQDQLANVNGGGDKPIVYLDRKDDIVSY